MRCVVWGTGEWGLMRGVWRFPREGDEQTQHLQIGIPPVKDFRHLGFAFRMRIDTGTQRWASRQKRQGMAP